MQDDEVECEAKEALKTVVQMIREMECQVNQGDQELLMIDVFRVLPFQRRSLSKLISFSKSLNFYYNHKYTGCLKKNRD